MLSMHFTSPLALHSATTARAPSATMREATYRPGVTAPAYLDGSLPADAGCDPLCLASLALPPGVEDHNVDYPCKGSILDTWCFFPWSLAERQAIKTNTPRKHSQWNLNADEDGEDFRISSQKGFENPILEEDEADLESQE